MSESTESITTDDEKLGVEPPKAIVHKQILDVAASRPEASLEAIADEVSGANATLVEHVLDEYGDPGTDAADGAATAESSPGPTVESKTSQPADAASTETETEAAPTAEQETAEDSAKPPEQDPTQDTQSVPTPDQLTAKQRETLELIAARPEATQSDIADELGVTSPTISQRVNAIDGFDWSNRHEIVQQLFEHTDETGSALADEEGDTDPATGDTDEQPVTTTESADSGGTGSDPKQTVDRADVAVLTERLDELSEQVSAIREDRRQADELTDRLEDIAGQLESEDDRIDAGRVTTRLEEVTSAVQSLQDDGPETGLDDRLDQLHTQLESVERRLDERHGSGSTTGALDDPELAHKVVHACFDSEQITKDEELRLLETMLHTGE